MIGVKNKRIILDVGSAIFFVCVGGFVAHILSPNREVEIIIAATSFVVAVIALAISARTYYSIDEVNAISRMDGNMMENPNYRSNIFRTVFQFNKPDLSEESKEFMQYLESLFVENKIKTGSQLADSVQEVADLLVLMPAFINTNDESTSAITTERAAQLISNIRRNVDAFKEISDGSCKLLDETTKLIAAVFAYQKFTPDSSFDPSKLLSVNGSVFVCPSTLILYYNYLGLYYFRETRSILSRHQANLSFSELIISAKSCTSHEMSIALVYCSKAIDAFQKAKDVVGDDMIWEGHICFNLARALYFQQLVTESYSSQSDLLQTDSERSEDWEICINESIQNWMTANKMIAELLASTQSNASPTWLQQDFISEENYVRLSKIIMQMMRRQPLTDHNGNKWFTEYGSLKETPFFQNIPLTDPRKLSGKLMKDIQHRIEINDNY